MNFHRSSFAGLEYYIAAYECSLYDSSNKDGRLQYSYLFDGEGNDSKTCLFYFQYMVDDNAEIGDTYFDIVISDACNTLLEPVTLSGSRCSLTIAKKVELQNFEVFSSGAVSTAVDQEFELSYSLSTSQIASGSFVLQYDPDLFELIELTQGAFLTSKTTDVNSRFAGAVHVAFAGEKYCSECDLLTVKFRTLKNVTETAEIKFMASTFYDLALNNISSTGYTTKINITYDETYSENHPSMFLSASYDENASKVTLTVNLEENSHLGAGDFILLESGEMGHSESGENGQF